MTDALVNDFALRSFRETADKDYIHARMAFRAHLMPQFLWSSLHCLEKYAKCILLLNRVKATGIKHEVEAALTKMAADGPFTVELSPAALQLIKRLENNARFRYYEVSYDTFRLDVSQLDLTVSEIRRYCQALHLDSKSEKTQKRIAELKLKQFREKADESSKDTCISNGWLEKVISQKDHPARKDLIYNNLFFGPSRRKRIKVNTGFEAGNAPLSLHPEIVDEVTQYVFLPKEVITFYRAQQSEQAQNGK